MGRDTDQLKLGAHTSIAGGLYRALERGVEIGARVVQLFAKNQVQWEAPPYSAEQLARFQQVRRETGVQPVAIHSAYLINPASTHPETWEKSLRGLIDELIRAEQLQVPYLVLHPGAHLGAGESAGLSRAAETIRLAFEEAGVLNVTLLLETTAGQGTNLGYCFEHLAQLMDMAPELPLGVCLDTCHVFAAGYDIRTPEDWERTLAQFEAVLGTHTLKLLHINDSRSPLGSRRDRHAALGRGELGLRCFQFIVKHPLLSQLPLILEIPGGLPAYAHDLQLLRSLRQATGQEIVQLEKNLKTRPGPSGKKSRKSRTG